MPSSSRSVGPLPDPGDAFVIPLADGRFGACRVLRKSKSIERASLVVGATAWVGEERPSVDDPYIRYILMLTHHAWTSEPAVAWISTPPPSEFGYLGLVQPTEAEMSLNCTLVADWQFFCHAILTQWRWDNDREALLAEETAAEAAIAEKQRRIAIEKQRFRDQATLNDLLKKPYFGCWEGGAVPSDLIKASRQTFHDTIRELMAMGANPKKTAVLGALRQCIERLNELNAREMFIDTVEREQICEELDEVAYVAGLGEQHDLAGRWRDW